MSNATGPVRKVSWGRTTLKLPNSNDVNFWAGGMVATESQEDMDGQTPLVEFKPGMLTGLTNRCSEPGSYQKMVDLVVLTTEGDVDIVVTLANGDKFSSPCFSKVDTTAFFSNRDGLAKMDLCPRNGIFSPV